MTEAKKKQVAERTLYDKSGFQFSGLMMWSMRFRVMVLVSSVVVSVGSAMNVMEAMVEAQTSL